MKKSLLAVVILATGLSITGCYNDNFEELYQQPSVNDCDTTNITYTGTLKSIVDNQCATSGCHAGLAPTGFDLRSYNGLKMVGKSRLMPALKHTGPFAMPKGMPMLDECTISKFQAWVNGGMPE